MLYDVAIAIKKPTMDLLSVRNMHVALEIKAIASQLQTIIECLCLSIGRQ